MIKKVIDGKKIIVKGNSKNIPSFKTIKEVYAKIPDNKRIPVVFETKEQYLDEYIKNQEKAKKTQFKPAQIAAYKHSELANMSNIVSRYTTNHNPFIDRRVVFFNDHKIPAKQFHDSALHEYGHELWEKNPKIRKDWRSVSNSTSPTPYGKTAKQEDFAESYMLHKTGRLADPRRERIISDDVGVNRIIQPWHGNIEQQSINNPNYRKVLETGKRAQLVLMSLKPKEEIGNEVHPKVDQFFRIEQGKAKFTLANGQINYNEGNGGAVFVPAGTWHNVTNASATRPLKLYTIYSPPNHKPGTIQKDRPSKDSQLYLPQTMGERYGNLPVPTSEKKLEQREKSYETYVNTFSELGERNPTKIGITQATMPLGPFDPTAPPSNVTDRDISAISQTLGELELKNYLARTKKAKSGKKLSNLMPPSQIYSSGTNLTVLKPYSSITTPAQRKETERDIAEGKGYRDYQRDWVPIDDTKPLPTVGQLILHPLDSGDKIFNAIDFGKTKSAFKDWRQETLQKPIDLLDKVLTYGPGIHTIREAKPDKAYPSKSPGVPLGFKLYKQFNTQDSADKTLSPRGEALLKAGLLGQSAVIKKDVTAKNSVKDELGGGTGREGMPYLKFNPPLGTQYPPDIEFTDQFKEQGLPKFFDPRGEITELGSKVYGSTRDAMFNEGTKEKIIDLSSNDIKVPSFKEAYSVLGNKALFSLNPSVSVDRIHALANDVSGVPSFTTMLAEAGTRPGINTTHWRKDPTILSKDTTTNNRIIRDDDSTNKLILKFDGNEAHITNTGDTIVTRNEAREIVSEMINRKIKGHTDEDKEVKRELGEEMMEELWPQVDADNHIIEGHQKFPKTYPAKDVSSKDSRPYYGQHFSANRVEKKGINGTPLKDWKKVFMTDTPEYLNEKFDDWKTTKQVKYDKEGKKVE